MSFGPAQREPVALGVDVFDRAGVDVDALDAAADVVGRCGPGAVMPLNSDHSKPPLLQTYTFPSGPIAAPLGPPPVVATRVTSPSRTDAGQGAALDFDDYDGSVIHGDRALREAESIAHDTKICHHLYPLAQVACDSLSPLCAASSATGSLVPVSSVVLMRLRSSRPELLELELLATTVITRPRRDPTVVLRVADLGVRVGRRLVIHDVSMHVRPGEIVSLVGHNGSGKTTTFRALIGLSPVEEGLVEIEEDTTVRYVPTERPVFADLVVRDNLWLGAGRAAPAVREARADRVLDLFPELRPHLARPAGVLSGGEQRMVAFGIALMADRDCCSSTSPRSSSAPPQPEGCSTTSAAERRGRHRGADGRDEHRSRRTRCGPHLCRQQRFSHGRALRRRTSQE